MNGKYDLTSEKTRHDSLVHAASAMSGPRQPQMPRLATIPLPSATKSEQRATYSANSPDGHCLQISKELFTALRDFLDGEKPAGSITIHFRNGGIAGVEALVKKHYK